MQSNAKNLFFLKSMIIELDIILEMYTANEKQQSFANKLTYEQKSAMYRQNNANQKILFGMLLLSNK